MTRILLAGSRSARRSEFEFPRCSAGTLPVTLEYSNYHIGRLTPVSPNCDYVQVSSPEEANMLVLDITFPVFDFVISGQRRILEHLVNPGVFYEHKDLLCRSGLQEAS